MVALEEEQVQQIQRAPLSFIEITSRGESTAEMVDVLDVSGVHVTPGARWVLCDESAIVTKDFTRRIVIAPAKLFHDGEDDSVTTTANVFEWANENKLIRPSLEAACLICQRMSRADIRAMGIAYLVVVCQFEDLEGIKNLSVFTDGEVVKVMPETPDSWWLDMFGFCFSCEVVDMALTQEPVFLVG